LQQATCTDLHRTVAAIEKADCSGIDGGLASVATPGQRAGIVRIACVTQPPH